MKLLLVFMVTVPFVYCDDDKLKKVLIGLLNYYRINVSYEIANEHLLQYEEDAVKLGEKYNVYDQMSVLLERANDNIIALPPNKYQGKHFDKALESLVELRDLLEAKANDVELHYIDFIIDLLSVLNPSRTVLSEHTMIETILKAAEINVSKFTINTFMPNLILECYQDGSKHGVNPHDLLNDVRLLLHRNDQQHPLSTGLRLLIGKLIDLDQAVHPKRNGFVGRRVLRQILDILALAKSRQDDRILDDLTDNGLTIFEQLVDNLKDLKTELLRRV